MTSIWIYDKIAWNQSKCFCHPNLFLGVGLPGSTTISRSAWTSNKDGNCLLPSCSPAPWNISFFSAQPWDLHARNFFKLCNKVSLESEELSRIINSVLFSGDQQTIMQFLIDCSAMPEVIRSVQTFGDHTLYRLMYIGRTWCYNIHRERMRQLGLLEFR